METLPRISTSCCYIPARNVDSYCFSDDSNASQQEKVISKWNFCVLKLIGNLKPFQFFFTARNAGSMSSCAWDGQIKTIQKHMISLKRTPKTSNQTIILPYSKNHHRVPASTNISFLKKKHKFHSFHVCFRWCILPHLVFSKKMRRFVSSRCSTLGLPGPFLRNANCFGASWGCKDWVPWWDKPCRYLCVYVCRKFKLQQIPGEKITCILYIYHMVLVHSHRIHLWNICLHFP